MKRLFLLSTLLLILCSCSQSNTAKYEPTWESLSEHNEAPEWLSDAKLGIYCHWGVYSVPAFSSEWYPYDMYRPQKYAYKHHIETYGEDFEYHNFAEMFTAEKFDAEQWAQLYKDAGARFGGLCAIHHDGYAMWASEVNPWNTLDGAPKRDIAGELLPALKAQGLKTITTFHHARTLQRYKDDPKEWATGDIKECGWHSHFAYNPERMTSSTDPVLAKMYGNMPADEFHQYWYDEIAEVVDNYSPDMIWFDSWFNMIPEETVLDMVAHYYNEADKKGQDVTIGFKQDDLPIEVGILDIEQGGKKELSERVWMTDVTLSNSSWSYVKGQTYKKADLVIRNMIDVWSKNGVVLLNISPRADGSIPAEQQSVLREIGDWMKKNGEAIYNTIPFDTYGSGSTIAGAGGHFGGQSATVGYTASDIRYTCSKDNKAMYLFFLGAPEVGKVIDIREIVAHRHPLRGDLKRVTLLGTDIEAEFKEEGGRSYITIPDAEMDPIATIFKFELE